MFNELLRFGFLLVLVILLMILLMSNCGTILVRTVLEGLLVLFRLILEVRRGDEPDGLLE